MLNRENTVIYLAFIAVFTLLFFVFLQGFGYQNVEFGKVDLEWNNYDRLHDNCVWTFLVNGRQEYGIHQERIQIESL